MWRVFLTCIWAIPLWLQPVGPTTFDQAAGRGQAGAAVRADAVDGLTDEQRAEPLLLIARKGQYRMRLYARGRLVKTYVIGLGQKPLGHKQEAGDNRTPEGRYRITQKRRGPFPGTYGAFMGTRWIGLSYPNDQDAEAGLRRGALTKSEVEQIRAAHRAGTQPPQDTKLGGGIGIHGWSGRWPGEDRQNLTWGCISLQNPDLEDLYDRVEIGTPVIILP
jgi:lipoprotein-anchoring transpeptidase ErfK/SrfK